MCQLPSLCWQCVLLKHPGYRITMKVMLLLTALIACSVHLLRVGPCLIGPQQRKHLHLPTMLFGHVTRAMVGI